MPQSKYFTWKFWERLFLTAGFIGALVGIIGVYYQLKNKKLIADFQVLSEDYLTIKNDIDGLKSDYSYRNTPVQNLWLMKFKITNTGDGTLIGEGKNSNILDTAIVLKFPNKVEILDSLKLIQSDFPHNIIKRDSQTIVLKFRQWRINESATYSMYLKSDVKSISLLPSVDRVILDGDFNIKGVPNVKTRKKEPLLEKSLPSPIPFIFRVIGLVIIGMFILFTNIALLFDGLPNILRVIFWKKRFYREYIAHVNSSEIQYIKDNRQFYIENPGSIYTDSIFWQEFKGDRVPVLDVSMTPWKDFGKYVLILLATNIPLTLAFLTLWYF